MSQDAKSIYHYHLLIFIMLEIIALIFLTKDVGKLALAKGLKPLTWKIYTVVAWVISEIIGVFVGALIFGTDNLVSVVLIGLTFAITSYFIIKARLNKLPDYFDNDIDNIGNN
jgi:hypothetical protein